MTRSGPRLPVVAGLAIVAAGFLLLARTTPDSGYPHLVGFPAVAGVGGGLTAAAATESVMAALPPEQAGLGSSINDATRQVGAALGVAVQGSVLTQTYTDRLHNTLNTVHAPAALTAVTHGMAPPAQALSGRQADLLHAATDAFCTGMSRAALVAALVAMIGAVLGWQRLPVHTTPTRRPWWRRLRKRLLSLAVRSYMALLMTRPTRPDAWRVPNPSGRYGPDDGPALNLLLLGDSLAVGVGVTGREHTVGALIATQLAQDSTNRSNSRWQPAPAPPPGPLRPSNAAFLTRPAQPSS